jgi:hypothetical protein
VTIGSRRRVLGLSFASLVAAITFWAPAFHHPEASGWGDWQWFHHMWEAGRIAITRWGEPPLFDPHHCGGVPLWGNPQAQVFAPTYLLLAVPFGTTIGHKLFVMFHCAVGLAGTYLFARRELRIDSLGASFAAILWTTSGYFAWHGAGGHATFLAFYYGPLLLFCWRRCAYDYRYSAAVAALMLLTVLEGGHYPFPYFVLWLTFDLAVRLLVKGRGRGRAIGGAVIAGLLTGLMGCARFVPILLALLGHPHPVPDTDSLRLDEILHILTVRDQAAPFPGHAWMWPEYGAYVGWGAIILAVVGLALATGDAATMRPARPRIQLVVLVLGLVLFTALTQGNASPHHPWPLLQHLPFYRSIHVPSRWRLMIVWHLALFGGIALDAIDRATRDLDLKRPLERAAAAVPVLMLLAMVGDVWSVTWPIVDRWDGQVIGAEPPAEHFHLVSSGVYLQDYANYPSRNVGTRECYDPVPWNISHALWTGDTLPARITSPDIGTVIDAGRTSLTLWADVEMRQAGRVIFDQNWFPDWVPDRGELADDQGRASVDLPAGRQRVTLRYRPRDLPYVVTVSAIGTLLTLLVASGRLPRRRRA